jgi:hypothetical membrane protein
VTGQARRSAVVAWWAVRAGVLAFLAIAAGCAWGAVGYVGTAGEPYSPLNHWISELGQLSVAAHAGVFNLMLVVGAASFIVFVVGLWLTGPSRLRWVFGPVGSLAGVGGILVGLFPMDHPDQHVLAASTFFNLGWIFVALASIAFVRNREARFPVWLAGVGAASVVAFIAFLVSLRTDDFARQRMASDGPIVGRPDVWVAPILEWATLAGIMAWVLLTSVTWWRQLQREGRAGVVAGGRAQ